MPYLSIVLVITIFFIMKKKCKRQNEVSIVATIVKPTNNDEMQSLQ